MTSPRLNKSGSFVHQVWPFFLKKKNVLEELATHGNHVITIKMTKYDWAKQPPKELLFRQYGIYILFMCNKFDH